MSRTLVLSGFALKSQWFKKQDDTPYGVREPIKKVKKRANKSTGQLGQLSAFPPGLHRGLRLPACGCVGD
jgi:hypothetical protein